MSTFVVRGLAYFVTHPQLWVTTLCPILLTLMVGVVSVVVLFAAGLYPQAEALEDAGVTPWLAWLLAVMLVLVEIFLVTLIYNLVVLGCYQDKIFEQVMVNRGYKELVENEERHAGCARVCRACCGVSVFLRLLLLVLTLPLNLIPVVGSVIYAWLNGTILAWEYHLYYFELKNYSYGEQRAVIDERKMQYSAFGMQALLLEMIPGVGSLFSFTNTVGAALFAAHMEDELSERKAHADGLGPKDSDPLQGQRYMPPGDTV